MNLLDWGIIVCLGLGALGGLRRGLVRSLLGLAGLVLGALLASALYRPLCGYLESHYSWVSRLAASLAPHLPLTSPVASVPVGEGSALTDAIKALDLPAFITRYLAASAGSALSPLSGATVGQALAHVLASAIIGVACFAAIFAVAQILVSILSAGLAAAIHVTPLGIVDHLAGAALGVAWSAFVLTLVLGGLGLLASAPAFAFVQPVLSGSKLAPSFVSFFQLLLPKVPGWLSPA